MAGNWTGNPADGDRVGLVDTQATPNPTWYFDTTGSGVINPASKVVSQMPAGGYPIVGDFDGDGHVDLGEFLNGTGMFYFQLWNATTGNYDLVRSFAVRGLVVNGIQTGNPVGNGYQLGARTIPVAADMDRDGITDVGLYVPDGTGATGTPTSQWFWLVSGDPATDTSGNRLTQLRQTGTVNVLASRAALPFSPFSPSLGGNLYAAFGNTYAEPVVGNFDPPLAATAPVPAATTTTGSQIVGDGQPGFWSSSSGTWSTGQGLDGGSLLSTTASGSKQSMAAWWFSMPAGQYDLSITYKAGSNLTKNLGLDLYDGVGNWIGQIPVNEQVAPNDFTDQGVGWKHLGSIKLTNNVFHISTWNSSGDGAIGIDAIQLRAAPVIDDGNVSGPAAAGSFSTSGVWAASTQGAFGGSRTSSSTVGSGASTATWTMPVTPGSYEVDVTWAAAGTLSAGATYTVYDGGTPLGSVTVNQQTAPADLTYEGQNWKSLGRFTITGTQLTVTLANTAGDGQVAADALRIRPADQPVATVNNGGPGSWSNAQWTTVHQGVGDALVSNTAAGSTQSQAAWWFPCRPGMYDVQVAWQPGSTYSQNAGFDVYNALTWIKQSVVNERNAPVGVTHQGVTWQSLGVFTMTSNVLHVSMWNSAADGAIRVDGVRIVPINAEMAAGVPSAAAAAPALLQADSLQPIVAAAEARWAAAGVAPALLARLEQTPIVVTDLPAGYLGLTEGNEILLSRNAAGFGWFVDSTPSANEEFTPAGGLSQFSFDENGTVPFGELKAIDPKAVDQIDLLTVVEHEMGHVLGRGDLDASIDALMSDQLGVGIRRLP